MPGLVGTMLSSLSLQWVFSKLDLSSLAKLKPATDIRFGDVGAPDSL